jgi:serine-type D-Ala-D-Ala carboxypeptidase/endopeptidase
MRLSSAVKAIASLVFALSCATGHCAPDDAAILEMLHQRIDISKRGVGIVVGVVDAGGSRVIAHGTTMRNIPTRVTGDTLFQLGSVTKVFNGVLLADMAQKGEVRLTDPIVKYLPPSVKSPRAKDITLLHLARHTAGLPNMPDDFSFSNPANPFGDYGNDRLFAFLDTFKTRRTVGSQHSYSNYGAALLGELLARRAGRDYETVLRERILDPLGMKASGITLTAERREAHAIGHSARNVPMPLPEERGMLASGALSASVNDLLKFLEANLDLRATPLNRALKQAQFTDADLQRPDLPMGIGWFHANIAGSVNVYHGGATTGFRAYVGMDPIRKQGVVVLSNTAYPVGDLGVAILNDWPAVASAAPPREFKAIELEPAVLQEFVGTYRASESDKDFLTFTRRGSQLFATSRSGTFPLQAESADSFFTEDMENWGTFTRDAAGRVDGLRMFREDWQQTLRKTK